MRINETPFPRYGKSANWADPIHEGAWRLPDLQESPPLPNNFTSDQVCVIPLFSDAYTRIENIEAYTLQAIYSRWSCLKYTNAVERSIAVKFMVEDVILDRIAPIFERNFIDIQRDVLVFNAPPLPKSNNGSWGFLGKQMQPFWDERLARYNWVYIWDADILFMPEDRTLKPLSDETLPNRMFDKIVDLPKEIGYIYVSIQDTKGLDEMLRHRLERETAQSGIGFDDLLKMSGVEKQRVTVLKPACCFGVYPAKHFHENRKDWIDWMRTYAPYWGNDEILCGYWARKFDFPVTTLANELDVLVNDIFYYFQSSPPGNILHGRINMQHEKELRELMNIV